ncbi:MAG: hypothetical protein LBG47_10295 [Prevotellaceae bacterium]|jgi:hypothetical protein|nr:hypothetical protein [Prevotellaceae bacterium]
MEQEERSELQAEIERLKKDLRQYLKIYPMLGVSDEEKERVVNQFLDDLLYRQKKLK